MVAISIFSIWTLVSIPSWSKSNAKDRMTTNIKIDSTINISNKQLVPGRYKIFVEGNEAKFERDGKVVAEAPCQVKTLPEKAKFDEIKTDHDRLTEIDLSGKTQSIQFGT